MIVEERLRQLNDFVAGVIRWGNEITRLRALLLRWDICPDCGGKIVDKAPEHRQRCPHLPAARKD